MSKPLALRRISGSARVQAEVKGRQPGETKTTHPDFSDGR
jgi:hypothetical protein